MREYYKLENVKYNYVLDLNFRKIHVSKLKKFRKK